MTKYKQVEVIYILRVSSKEYSIKELQNLFMNPSKSITQIWDKLPNVKKLSEVNCVEFEAKSYDYVDLEESLDGLLKNIILENFHKVKNNKLEITLYIPIYSKYANPGIWIKKNHIKILSQIDADINFDVFQIN